MKKIKLDASRLQLKKEKIVALTSNEMQQIKGGADDTGTYYLCPSAPGLTVMCSGKPSCTAVPAPPAPQEPLTAIHEACLTSPTL